MYDDDDDDFQTASRSFARKPSGNSSAKLKSSASKLSFVLKKPKAKATEKPKLEVQPDDDDDDGANEFGKMEHSLGGEAAIAEQERRLQREEAERKKQTAEEEEARRDREREQREREEATKKAIDEERRRKENARERELREAKERREAQEKENEIRRRRQEAAAEKAKKEEEDRQRKREEEERAAAFVTMQEDDKSPKRSELSPASAMKGSSSPKHSSGLKASFVLSVDEDDDPEGLQQVASMSMVDVTFAASSSFAGLGRSTSFASPVRPKQTAKRFEFSVDGGSVENVNTIMLPPSLKSMCLSFSKRQITPASDISPSSSNKANVAIAFDHSLPPAFQDDYFSLLERHIGRIDEEDVAVCNDMAMCCRYMEQHNLWSPSKDTLNSQMQTLIQQPLRDLLKNQAWEQLKFCRDSLVRDFVNVLQQVGDFSELSKLLAIGSSWLLPDRGLMIHVWQTPEAARMFYTGWSRIWQCIFEHRVQSIFAPVSILYHCQGAYCSITALPPVLAFSSEPVIAPGPAAGPMLGFYARQLLNGLYLSSVKDVPLYQAADGRYYVLSTKPLRDRQVDGLPRNLALQPLLRDHYNDAATSTLDGYINDVAIPRAVDSLILCLDCREPEDRRIEPVVRDRLIPKVLHDRGINVAFLFLVLQHCKSRLHHLGAPRDGLFVAENANEQAEKATEADKGYGTSWRAPIGNDEENSDDDEADGGENSVASIQAMQREQLRKHPYSLGIDQIKSLLKHINKNTTIRHLDLLVRTITTEMVGRTVKDMVRLDLCYGAGNVPHNTEIARINVINRFARLLVSSHHFWKNIVGPRMRSKFRCTDDFSADPHLSSPSAVLRLVASRMGAAFHPQSGRFGSFSPIGDVWCTLFDPQDLVERTLQKSHFFAEVQTLWKNLQMIMAEERQALVMRATCLSLVSRTCADEVRREWEATKDSHAGDIDFAALEAPTSKDPAVIYSPKENEDASSFTPKKPCNPFLLHMASMMIEMEIIMKRKPETFSILTHLARTHTHPTDISLSSTLLIDAAELRSQSKFEPTVELQLYRDGFIQFLTLDHVDFTYSFLHVRALRALEHHIRKVKRPSDGDLALEVVAAAAETLHAMNRIPNAANLLREALVLGLGVRGIAHSSRAGAVATQSYGAHVIAHGRSHPRSTLAAFMMAYYCVCGLHERSVRVPAIKQKIILVIKTLLASEGKPAKQIGLAKGNTVLVLFHRVVEFLVMHNELRPAQALLTHVLHHAPHQFAAANILQRWCRAFADRIRLGKVPR